MTDKPLYFIYIDETGDQSSVGYSALCVPAAKFHDSLRALKEFRRKLNRQDAIYINKELHAYKFTSGRGRPNKPGTRLPTARRCEIFNEMLEVATALPEARLINAFRHAREKHQLLERLLTRIDRTMAAWESRAVLIFDQGDEKATTKLVRRMTVFNPVASVYGKWENGQEYKNIPLANILEDPVFRSSESSYFVQLVDFCAYALMQKEKPTASRQPYGLHQSFNLLRPICFRKVYRKDPDGIIR